MARFSLHTVGRDRPGIIAHVTHALADFGAQVEESNMTILHGQSSIMLILEAPNIEDGSLIEQALEQVAEELNLFVTVCPLPEDPPAVVDGESFLISVDGAARPGVVVASVTTALAELGANVIDLTSRGIVREGHFDYGLRLSVTLPAHVSFPMLEATMVDVAAILEVNHSVRPWSGEVIWDAGASEGPN
jgi:predicted amino acid-binding ACT domain protein